MRRTLQYVLEQSARGHHHLFDRDLIHAAFVEGDDVQCALDEGTAERASSLIDELRSREHLDDQRACIAAAPPRVQQVVVHLYFHYLDRYMSRAGVSYH